MTTPLKYRTSLSFCEYSPVPNHPSTIKKSGDLRSARRPRRGISHSKLVLDDINNKALYEKLAGVRDRVKYRIRIYNVTDSTIHFEKNQIPGLHCQAEGAAHKGDGRSDHGRSIRMSLSAGQAIDDGAVSRDEA